MFRKKETPATLAEIFAKLDLAEKLFMDALRSKDEEIARLKQELSARESV
jgi:hypothetical protein